MNRFRDRPGDQSSESRDGWSGLIFEAFFTLWAVISIPLLIAVAGIFLYVGVGETWVIVVTVVCAFLGLLPGIALARLLRRAGRDRGGMAGSMAAHATPDLDKVPEESSAERDHRENG